MTVYCNSSFSDDLRQKNYFVTKFLGGMIYHFQDLEFGKSVGQIIYVVVCGPESYLSHYGIGIFYGRRNTAISSLFTISYNKVKELEGKSLLEYVAGELVSETSKFEKVRPKEFDFSAYKNSLSKYLEESIETVMNGRDPSDNKILRDDIQQAMWKKFSRL